VGQIENLDSAGINRHGVTNERILQEGVANHPGPEPCEGSRKAVLEALDRGICRLGIELRNQMVREPTASDCKEGNNASHASASATRPCGVEDPKHAEKLHAREPGDPVAAREQCGAGRRENAMSDKTLMHGGGESYSGIVPAKQPNKSEQSPAEDQRVPRREGR